MGTNSAAKLARLAMAALLLGCAADDGSTIGDEATTIDERTDALDVDLPLYHFDDTVKPYATRFRNIIKSASEYSYYVGHDPPSWIDFGAVWVVFATTGTMPTDGYEMHIDRMRFFTSFGYNLYPYFREVSPGPGCDAQPIATQADALATFPIPPYKPRRTRFQNEYEVRDCTLP